MTPWQAVWYVLGVLLYPCAFGLMALGLTAFGMTLGTAYLVSLFGLPFIWLPLNAWVMHEAYKREGKMGELDDRPSSLLAEKQLIR